MRFGTELLKRGFAKMQKGGVVMDVTNAEQAAIAEEAGSVAVMALERVPADIRAAGGVARMADPVKIQEIMDSVTVPVMAKCRIGHEAEARALESMGVDMIDESEVLTPADPFFHVNKRGFSVPFVCGCRNLGEAVRRVWEGAAMIRTKGEAGTGDIIEAVRHVRLVNGAIRELTSKNKEQVYLIATKFADNYTVLLKEIRTAHGEPASVSEADVVFANENLDTITEGLFQILTEVKKIQRLPVVNFAAGGIATPADAALMMLMGCDGVFVGSGIFKSENPEGRGRAIVDAVAHFDDPSTVAEVSKGIGLAMKGMDAKALPIEARLQDRGTGSASGAGHQPRSCNRASIGSALASMPFIARPIPFETSATVDGSSKWATASTIARPRPSGFSDLKIPDPTKTPSQPMSIISAASAGVATPPAAKLTTGSRWIFLTSVRI